MHHPSLRHVLTYAPNCTPTMIRNIAAQYRLAEILQCSATELKLQGWSEATIFYLLQQNWPEVEQDLLWANNDHCHILSLEDPLYPPLLKEIPDPPPILYAKGDITLLFNPQIAIVGTRKPTPNGRQTAMNYAAALAKQGWTITSGLALGIDAASHTGCLAVQGKTIAVLGHGLNHIYPRSHAKLNQEILEQGLLISELSPNMPPLAGHFPRRNRIISGLSVATVVIEAALQSGSLITARLAAEQGREVFAIPGSIYNVQARGCHALIKNGAKLVETVEDILEELFPLLNSQLDLTPFDVLSSKSQIKLDKNQANVLKYVSFEPTTIESIIAHSGITYDVILTALMQLELNGYIVATLAGYTRCVIN